MQFITEHDHDSLDDLFETSTFSAETAVTVDEGTFVVTTGGSVREDYGGEALYSALDGFQNN